MTADYDGWARHIIRVSARLAVKCRSDYVGTEHLLLALLKQSNGAATHVLRHLGVSLRDVRHRLDRMIRSSSPAASANAEPRFSPKARLALEEARIESMDLGDDYIGSHHILLGLLRVRDGVASLVLADMAVTTERARREAIEFLGGDPAGSDEVVATAVTIGDRRPTTVGLALVLLVFTAVALLLARVFAMPQ